MPSEIEDAAIRREALDPGRSFIVQAPAGSGKTELLAQRTLALLGTVQAPEEVIAITFTRKAAGEMRTRILQALSRAAEDETPTAPHEKITLDLAGRVLETSRSLGWELESSPGRLRIQTIDSLCSGLVSRMPLLSSLGGQGRISDNPGEMYLQAARSTVAQLNSSSPEGRKWRESIRTLLRHLDNDHDKTCRLIAGMLPQREKWLRHLAHRGNSSLRKQDLEQALSRAVQEELQEVSRLMPGEEIPRISRLAGFAASNLEDPDQKAFLDRLAGLDSLPGCDCRDQPAWLDLARFCLTKGGTIRRTADKSMGFPAPSGTRDPELKAGLEEMKARFKACMQTLSSIPGLEMRLQEVRLLPGTTYSSSQWQTLKALFDVLRLAAAYLHLEFQEQGSVDFSEITTRAMQALGPDEDPTDLALVLDNRIQHLLMDEFQDTSISQFQLLLALTAGWTPGDGRTFFAVGDPMQSIYGFREAEVGLFLQARSQGLGHIPLEPLRLTVNFRSQAGIVNWANQAFPRVLPQVEDQMTGSVPYSASHASLPSLEGPAVNIHPFFDADYQPESSRVVSLIQQARQEDPRGTVAILVRSRLHLQAILPDLRQSGLEYQAVEIDALSSRPVIQDLCSLAGVLTHPGHNLAWLAVLRAPWCGLELKDMAVLAEDKNALILNRIQDQDLLSRLSPRGRKRLDRVREILLQFLGQRQRSGLRKQVESCWKVLGGPDCLHSESQLRDAEVFFRLLQERLEHAPHRVVDELENAVAGLFAGPDTSAGQNLQVMTIHKAKGLEFDTVILPGLGRPPGSDEHQLLVWMERASTKGRTDLLMAPRTATGQEKDPVYAYIQRLMARKTRHEDGRLLYVACTRARKRLHLLGHTRLTEKGLPSKPAGGSLLESLWPAVQEEFEEAAQNFREDAAEDDPPAQGRILYRLHPDWQPPLISAGLKPLSDPRPDPGEESIVFDWAGETIRLAGTCVHRWMLVMAGEGINKWSMHKIRGLKPVFARQLRELGLMEENLEQGVDLVQQALENTLNHDIGRWILGPWPGARNEFALSGLDNGREVAVSMDRTFVDDTGLRWIIDYKISRHSGGDVQGFLDREQARYRERMQTYARLMQAAKPGPVELGLYFPLLRQWRHWPAGSFPGPSRHR